MKSLSTFIKEARNQNLMFKPSSSSDFKKLVKWLDKSPYHADVYKDYVVFPEDDLDALEMELDKEFVKLGIDGYFEAVYESVNEASYADIMSKISDSHYKKIVRSEEYRKYYNAYLNGDKHPSAKERQAAHHFAVQNAYSEIKESADYNKQPLKVGDSVEVIDYDDAVGKIIKLEGNSATVEIKSGTYAGKSKHETKNLVKL